MSLFWYPSPLVTNSKTPGPRKSMMVLDDQMTLKRILPKSSLFVVVFSQFRHTSVYDGVCSPFCYCKVRDTLTTSPVVSRLSNANIQCTMVFGYGHEVPDKSLCIYVGVPKTTQIRNISRHSPSFTDRRRDREKTSVRLSFMSERKEVSRNFRNHELIGTELCLRISCVL